MFPRHSFKELIDLEALVNVTVWKKDQFSPSQQPNQFYRSSCIINTCSLIKIHLGLGVVVTVCLFNSITYLITSEYLQIQFPFTLSWTRAKNASAAELTFPLFPGITPATWSVYLFAHTSTISHCCLLRAWLSNARTTCPVAPWVLIIYWETWDRPYSPAVTHTFPKALTCTPQLCCGCFIAVASDVTWTHGLVWRRPVIRFHSW